MLRKAIAVYLFLSVTLGLIRIQAQFHLLFGMDYGLLHFILWVLFILVFPCWASIWLWGGRESTSWRRLFPAIIMQALQIVLLSTYRYWSLAVAVIVVKTPGGWSVQFPYFSHAQLFVFGTREELKVLPWWTGPPLLSESGLFLGINLIPVVLLVILVYIGVTQTEKERS